MPGPLPTRLWRRPRPCRPLPAPRGRRRPYSFGPQGTPGPRSPACGVDGAPQLRDMRRGQRPGLVGGGGVVLPVHPGGRAGRQCRNGPRAARPGGLALHGVVERGPLLGCRLAQRCVPGSPGGVPVWLLAGIHAQADANGVAASTRIGPGPGALLRRCRLAVAIGGVTPKPRVSNSPTCTGIRCDLWDQFAAVRRTRIEPTSAVASEPGQYPVTLCNKGSCFLVA
jgi:hypothetical protein